MPIVTVELVRESDAALELTLAQAIADAVGRALDSPPGQTWVRLHALGRNQYAENVRSVQAGELPVFVTVIKRHIPVSPELQTEVALLTHAVAQAVGRPATCVHVEYAPAAASRLAFGGKLVQ